MVNGWERVDYIKPSPDFHATPGYGFDETFDLVAAEVSNVSRKCRPDEVNGFNRIEIGSADRHAFLDRMACGFVTRRAGRVGLAYLLNHHGCIKAEATFANLPASERGPDRVWYGSAAASEQHDMDWLAAHVAPGEDVQLRSLTNDQTILVLAGPRARQVLAECARGDWSAGAFPWLSVRECCIGFAPATVMGVSFSGELAYEIHVPNASLYAAYLALRAAGEAHGMKLFGARAVESMRMEKGFLHWKADLTTEFDPFETGLSRFVKLDKGDFIGKAALRERQRRGPGRRLVTLRIDAQHAPAHQGASLMDGAEVVGTITSAAYGYRVGMNLAYAFVRPQWAEAGTTMQLDLCGDLVGAQVIEPSPHDPDFERMRG
ncbi:MAG: aminomethyltransferase family protein [Nitratireductor sp.]